MNTSKESSFHNHHMLARKLTARYALFSSRTCFATSAGAACFSSSSRAGIATEAYAAPPSTPAKRAACEIRGASNVR